MTLTTIDPKTALIVVDLQKGIVALPVVLVTVAGSPPGRTDSGSFSAQGFPADWAELIPELGHQPGDILVTKYARSAFSGTGLTDQLRGLGVTQVALTGIATSSGVESTARHAYEDGFHVTLPTGAMSDPAAARHEHSVAQIFPRIAETGTTGQLLALLDHTRP